MRRKVVKNGPALGPLAVALIGQQVTIRGRHFHENVTVLVDGREVSGPPRERAILQNGTMLTELEWRSRGAAPLSAVLGLVRSRLSSLDLETGISARRRRTWEDESVLGDVGLAVRGPVHPGPLRLQERLGALRLPFDNSTVYVERVGEFNFSRVSADAITFLTPPRTDVNLSGTVGYANLYRP